jgi:hypothetical protein
MQSAIKSTDDDLPLLDKKIAIAWDKKKTAKTLISMQSCNKEVLDSNVAISNTDASSEGTTELSNTD